MNSARLARKWERAKGDPRSMAESLPEEIEDSATGLVSRDHLAAKLAETESHHLRTLVVTQIAGFVGLAVWIMLKQ